MVVDQSAEVAKLKRANAVLEKEIEEMEESHAAAVQDFLAKISALKTATAASATAVCLLLFPSFYLLVFIT